MMPIYCYNRLDTGESIELEMTIAEMKRRQGEDGLIILDDGGKAIRDIVSEHNGHIKLGEYRISSNAAAIHPDQIPEYKEFDRKMGCKVNYLPDGRPVFESRAQRRDYLKAHGLHDKDAGYGD